MGVRQPSRPSQVRAHLASEAARLMVEGGSSDFHAAKRKAAERLRVGDARQMPTNDEIEAAIAEYQRLFRNATQPDSLARLRAVALDAMEFLQPFKPRLVGPVLAGTADAHSEVVLHVFADAPEDVGWFLMDRGIPFDQCERRLRIAGVGHERLPAYRFVADGVPIELIAFCGRQRRHDPLSPVDGRAMERASLVRLRALLERQG